MARNNSEGNGCGCLILLALYGLVALCVNMCNEPKTDITKSSGNTSSAYQYSQVKSTQVEEPIVKEELTEEDKKYLGNSLSTGATPYIKFYGKNYKCPYNQCSGIK